MIDAHHHIWRRGDLPWLDGPEQPRIFGSYSSIRRDYLIDEYSAEAQASGVTRSVYVQANWAAERAVDEAAWVQAVADNSGWPHAIVAYADVTGADPRPEIDRLLAAAPLLRGIRQQFHWHRNREYRFASRPDLCCDPNVQRNIARLGEYGLAFDLQIFTSQIPGAVALAESCRDVTFIVQHAGMPEDLSADAMDLWEAGMQMLARCPNVCVKLSGQGTFVHRNDEALIAGIVEKMVALFGPARCMFGSNFPIEKIWTDFESLTAAYRAACGKFSEAARNLIFEDTAARVYRMPAGQAGTG